VQDQSLDDVGLLKMMRREKKVEREGAK